MTDHPLPIDPQNIAEELRDSVLELYQELWSLATEKGSLFTNPTDVAQLVERGGEALEILRKHGLVIVDVATRDLIPVWRLPKIIDIRSISNTIGRVIDLTQSDEHNDDTYHNPARDPT